MSKLTRAQTIRPVYMPVPPRPYRDYCWRTYVRSLAVRAAAGLGDEPLREAMKEAQPHA